MPTSPADAVDTATRIAAGDDKTRYDGVSVALHWTTAALVLIQFLLSQFWSAFGRPTHHVMVVAHMSFGILLAAVVLFRIVWRLMPNHRVSPITLGWMEIASRGVHYLLYALLAVEAVLGFILRWAGAEAMSFFGILVPPPFAPWSRAAHHQVGEFHEKIGWAIVIVALGHAAAALYHHFVKHDRVLVRMAPWIRQR